MYAIYRNGRKNTHFTFANYERARQFVRRKLRKLTFSRHAGQPDLPFHLFGYEIRNVA